MKFCTDPHDNNKDEVIIKIIVIGPAWWQGVSGFYSGVGFDVLIWSKMQPITAQGKERHRQMGATLQ